MKNKNWKSKMCIALAFTMGAGATVPPLCLTAATAEISDLGVLDAAESGAKVSDYLQIQCGDQTAGMQLYQNQVYEGKLALEAGSQKIQILRNGQPDESLSVSVDVPEGQDIYVRVKDGQVSCSAGNTGVGMEFHTAALVGNWQEQGIRFAGAQDGFDVAWVPEDPNAELKYCGGGIYSRTFTLAEAVAEDTEIQYKIAFDDTWDGDYSLGETRNGDNVKIVLPAGTTSFTVWVDDLNSKVYDSVRSQNLVVSQMSGDKELPAFATRISLIGSMNDWNTAAEGYDFVQISDQYYLYQGNLAAGTYQYKVLFDGSLYYEKEGNQILELAEDTPVLFLYDAESGYVFDTVNEATQIARILGFEAEPAKAQVKDQSNGTTQFVLAGIGEAESVKLVYAPREDSGAETTVPMRKSDTGDGGFYSDNLFLGDEALDYVYYYLVDGKRTTVDSLEMISLNGQEYNHYTRDVFEGRPTYIPGTFPGESWNPAANLMEYKGKGLYQYTFKNVPAANYEYKIAMGSWAENYGEGGSLDGANIPVAVPETMDVTISYNDFSHRSVTSVDYIFADVELKGTNVPENTKLTDGALTGIYSATIPMEAGIYEDYRLLCDGKEYKFASFEVKTAKDVTFYYDPATEIYYCDASDEKVETEHIFYDTRDESYKSVYGAVEQGEKVHFSIDTGKDADRVTLIFRGPETQKIEMSKDADLSGDKTDRWTADAEFSKIGSYSYYFVIYSGTNVAVYSDDDGNYGRGKASDLGGVMPYDLIVYEKGFTTPDWMKNGVIYQIFPDRFFNGDTSNDRAQLTSRGDTDYEFVTDWYMWPENPEQEELNPDEYPAQAFRGDGNWSNEIYGGDLKGITERIGYLKALGVTVIYLNPVFQSISSHRYDATDYNTIDPILGDLGDFTELVQAAESNDMHIVLDGVFNHVSDDSVYFDRYYRFVGKDGHVGAYPYWAYVFDTMEEQGCTQDQAESQAKEYFQTEYKVTDFTYTKWFGITQDAFLKDDDGETVTDSIGWRKDKPVYGYEGWWGYDSMPVILSTDGSEYQTPGWADEIISGDNSVGQYWLRQGSDGWRLDVANEVSDETWRNFRSSVKSLDSDNVIIGEIWTDATKYLLGDMYDSVMNYVFRNAVLSYAKGGDAGDSMKTLERIRERYPEEAFYAMMNLVGSHDTTRLLSYLDGVDDDRNQKEPDMAFPTYEKTSEAAKQSQYLTVLLQMTYPGAPTIYYGDELGMTGADDPDDRRAMEWGKGSEELVNWYAKLAAVRAAYEVLRTGAVEPVSVRGEDGPNGHLMAFFRENEEQKVLVAANNNETAELAQLPADPDVEVYADVISGNIYEKNADGSLDVEIPARSGVILMPEDQVVELSVDYEGLRPAYDPEFIVEEVIPTVTPEPTGTPTVTPTQEPTKEPTNTPTKTPTNTPSNTPKPDKTKPNKTGNAKTGDETPLAAVVAALLCAASCGGVLIYKKKR